MPELGNEHGVGWCFGKILPSPAWLLKAVVWLLVGTVLCQSSRGRVVTILRTNKMVYVFSPY